MISQIITLAKLTGLISSCGDHVINKYEIEPEKTRERVCIDGCLYKTSKMIDQQNAYIKRLHDRSKQLESENKPLKSKQ